MKNIIVIGAGMVGSAMAIDMLQKYKVTLSDISPTRLNELRAKHPALDILPLDVKDTDAVQQAVKGFDLVICAVPGFLGFKTIKTIIEAGKNIVDISFFPEDALELDALAKEKGVTVIVDCGVAPGMGNFILGRYNEILRLTDFECLVGGLPKTKTWPFYYKAPFSPVDVIEEYTRPARYVENGNIIVREPLTDCEFVEFDKVGTLESFNTDGLRSILFTMPHIPNRKEKTLRYPGHVEIVRALKQSGFFSPEKININGVSVSPLAVTSRVLFDDWKLGDTEEELTVMRISLKGIDEEGNQVKVEYNLYDEYNPVTQTSSMARTTGYTATAAANMFLEGLFTEKGVFPPELIGKHETCFDYILQYLNERDVVYCKTVRQ
ncbi:MAG: saccharopine dehydrogenase NADP-binding domain-containing protein [Saprospiraceae bacterium]|nr:saccharopine dehydrogenase NADP-binding domain-containing protein [Candidatus Opimibacter iunctus]